MFGSLPIFTVLCLFYISPISPMYPTYTSQNPTWNSGNPKKCIHYRQEIHLPIGFQRNIIIFPKKQPCGRILRWVKGLVRATDSDVNCHYSRHTQLRRDDKPFRPCKNISTHPNSHQLLIIMINTVTYVHIFSFNDPYCKTINHNLSMTSLYV